MPKTTGDESAEPGPKTSDLIDISGLDVSDLLALPDNVIGMSLRRILTETQDEAAIVAGFQSAI